MLTGSHHPRAVEYAWTGDAPHGSRRHPEGRSRRGRVYRSFALLPFRLLVMIGVFTNAAPGRLPHSLR